MKNVTRLFQVILDVLVGVGVYTFLANSIAKLVVMVFPQAAKGSIGLSVLIGFIATAIFAEYFEISGK